MRDLAVLVAHRGSASNLGDRLLQDILRQSLQDCGASVLVQHDPAGGDRRSEPGPTSLVFYLSVLRSALRSRIDGAPRTTVFLPPGQSLIKTVASLPRVAVRLAYLSLLKSAGARIVCLGRDFSGQSWLTRLNERAISRLADYYGLRDGAAIKRAGEIGVRNAVWFPDLSWLAPAPASLPPFSERGSVVLCFRSLTGPLATDRRGADSFVGAIAGLIDEAGALGLKEFVLVSHDSSDRPIMQAIQETCRQQHSLRCLPGLLDRGDIPAVYGRAALVLSNRLHALLLGLQHGAVVLALVRASAQTKITGQLTDIGLADQIIDAGTAGPSDGLVRSTLERHRFVGRVVDDYRVKAIAAARLALSSLFT